MSALNRWKSELKSRVVSPFALGDREKSAWTTLCHSQPHLNSPFYSLEYTYAVAHSQPDVFVCVIEEHGQPVAFLPFQFRNKLWKLIGFAQRVGGDMTDYFGLIAPRGFCVESSALLEMAQLRYLYFTHLDETQLAHGLEGIQPELGMKIEIGNVADYWADLRKRYPDVINELGRRGRKLAKEVGTLRFSFEVREWDAPARELLSRKSRQYVESGGGDILDSRGKQRLLQKLLESKSDDCRAILSTLYAGDTWVASHLGLRGRNVLHYWFPAYNPALRNFGPGMLLLREVINAAPAEGVTVIDRGAGTGVHKTKFANATHRYYRGTWERAGFGSTVCYLACSAQLRLDRLKDRANA